MATIYILVSPAAGIPDLTPSIFVDATTIVKDEVQNKIIRIFNIGPGATSGTIVFTIPKLGVQGQQWELTVNPTETSMNLLNLGGVVAVNNNDWIIADEPLQFRFTSKPGIIIPSSGFSSLGMRLKAHGIPGTSGNLNVRIAFGTGGGETPFTNNFTVTLHRIN